MTSERSSEMAAGRSSCLTCHRRKLKCSREIAGCENCKRSGVACTYPAPETRLRQRRGPYQKSKNKRESELEDAVRAIEKKYEELAAKIQSNGAVVSPESAVSTISPATSTTRADSVANNGATPSGQRGIAKLTTSFGVDLSGQSLTENNEAGSSNEAHPPNNHHLDYWHIYSTKIDPLIKIVHRPSFGRFFFAAQNPVTQFDNGVQALLFSMYFASIRSLSAEETKARFGESRDVLLQRHQASFEECLAAEQGRRQPSLACLQGLLIYMIALRRQEGDDKLWPLFGLALRMAQVIGIDSEGENAKVTFFEGQMRRRLWWSLCWLETKYAEDRIYESTASIMEWPAVDLPLNLNDADFGPDTVSAPQSRVGFTDMTLCLTRFEVNKVIFELVKSDEEVDAQDPMEIFIKKASILDDSQAWIQQQYLSFCDESRPIDRLVLSVTGVLLAKAKLIVQKALAAATPIAGADEEDTFNICLGILEMAHYFHQDAQLEEWRWIYRGSVQLPSLLLVASALGQENGKQLDAAVRTRAVSVCTALFPLLAEREQQSRQGQHLISLLTRAQANSQLTRASGERSGTAVPGSDPSTVNDLDCNTIRSLNLPVQRPEYMAISGPSPGRGTTSSNLTASPNLIVDESQRLSISLDNINVDQFPDNANFYMEDLPMFFDFF